MAATVERGDFFCFALGLNPGPERGHLHFRVSFEGSVLYDKTPLRVGQKGFVPACVEVPVEGSGTFDLSGEAVRANGRPLPDDPDERAWISVASLRLAHPKNAGRRVLVWISQDTLRADHLETYGYRRATAPAFARFASTAAVFDAAVSPSSWTLPALTAQFTSRYPSFHSGGLEFGERLRGPGETDIFDVLEEQGFSVFGVTGNRFVSSESRLASGFSALCYLGQFPSCRAAAANTQVRTLLDQWHGEDLAFFVHYMDPHAPYEPPQPFDSLFEKGYRGPATGSHFDQFTQLEDVAHVKALYDGAIAYADQEIGELLDLLENRGILKDAVVVYSADHGEEFLDHGGWQHGQSLYNELLHIPLAIRLPGRPPCRIQRVVSGVDIAPTVLEALGLSSPASFQGRSLLPLIEGRELPQTPVFAETSHAADRHLRVAVQEGMDKYVSAMESEQGPVLREELYDLRADPSELQPLRVPNDLARFRRIAAAFLSEAAHVPPGSPPPISHDTRLLLESLGYGN